jgi:hypothetical protein
VFESLWEKGTEPLIIQQCKFLENVYGTHFTDALLSQGGDSVECALISKSVRAALEEEDRKYIWEQVSSRESLAALTPDINWLKLWDDTRDHSLSGARALEATLLILTTPKYENYSCYICGHKPVNLQRITLPTSTSAALLINCGNH